MRVNDLRDVGIGFVRVMLEKCGTSIVREVHCKDNEKSNSALKKFKSRVYYWVGKWDGEGWRWKSSWMDIESVAVQKIVHVLDVWINKVKGVKRIVRII